METTLRQNLFSSEKQQHNRLIFITIRSLFLFYKTLIGPALQALGGSSLGCKYPQSCSEFAYQSILQNGFFRGSWLALRRVLSCNPWSAPKEDLMFASTKTTTRNSIRLAAFNKDTL